MSFAKSFQNKVGNTIDDVNKITSKILAIDAYCSDNSLFTAIDECALDFRSSDLTNGDVNTRVISSELRLNIPNGATLNTVSGQLSRLILLATDYNGIIEPAITYIRNGQDLTEMSLITTKDIKNVASATGVIAVTTGILTISSHVSGTWEVGQIITGTGVPANTYITALIGGSGGNGTYQTNIITAVSSTAMTGVPGTGVYANIPRINVPFRVCGVVESTQTTAGVWASQPTLKQGMGGQALSSMGSIGNGQSWIRMFGNRSLGTTYYNTTGKSIQISWAAIATATASVNLLIGGVLVNESIVTASSWATLSGIIPPFSSYVINVTSGSITTDIWSELR